MSTFFAQPFTFDMFNEKLSEAERTKLLAGEMLIRNIDKKKNVCLKPVNENTKKILFGLDALDPNYTAEVIRIIPDNPERTESVTSQLNAILLKLEDYAGIPYYSERAEKWYDLYSSVTVKESEVAGTKTGLLAEYEMEPFGFFDCDIRLDYDGESLYYKSENLEQLRYYDKFTCVRPNNMHIYITAFKSNGYTILYAVGGVDAPSIFFLRGRVETSFINRIKTFCSYMFEKLR